MLLFADKFRRAVKNTEYVIGTGNMNSGAYEADPQPHYSCFNYSVVKAGSTVTEPWITIDLNVARFTFNTADATKIATYTITLSAITYENTCAWKT